MPKIKLSRKTIDGLGVTDKPVIHWDTEVKGLGLWVGPTGHKSFVVQKRVNGRSSRISLGEYGPVSVVHARERAMTIIADIAKGIDPVRDREQQRAQRVEDERRGITVAGLFERWMEDHVRPRRAPRTVLDYEANYRRYIGPQFGSTCVRDIKTRDVESWHASMSNKPRVANYALVNMRTMINWGIDREILDVVLRNPTAKVELYKSEERERFLTEAEIRRVGKAISELVEECGKGGGISPYSAAALMFCLLTGVRSGLAMGLLHDEVDFRNQKLRLNKRKKHVKDVRLNEAAVRLLQSIPRVDGNPHVFVGQRKGSHLTSLQSPWEAVCARAGIENCRVHDLRHSFASMTIALGTPLAVLSKLLGHHRLSTTERYGHLVSDHVNTETEKAGVMIGGLLGHEEHAAKP
jgi:integrase